MFQLRVHVVLGLAAQLPHLLHRLIRRGATGRQHQPGDHQHGHRQPAGQKGQHAAPPAGFALVPQDLRQEQAQPVGLRVVEQRLRRALFHDLAAVHEHHAVGHGAREAHFMRHH